MYKKLTPIQNQVLHYLKDCKSNEEIANELNYSIHNVKKIIRSLHKFFKTKKREELAVTAVTMYFTGMLE